jgi:hypothetical protein
MNPKSALARILHRVYVHTLPADGGREGAEGRRPLMRIQPHFADDARPGIVATSPRRNSTQGEPLTPAQRVALTIALLNHGFDVMDHAARTCLTGCARRIGRPGTGVEAEHRAGGTA